jgi:hypothetical protein
MYNKRRSLNTFPSAVTDEFKGAGTKKLNTCPTRVGGKNAWNFIKICFLAPIIIVIN